MQPKGKKELVVSSDIIAPCLCFQVTFDVVLMSRKHTNLEFLVKKNKKKLE